MPESRIKLKELASQIGKDPKDLLPAAQKLGSSIKSVQGSVSEEEAQRLRQQFAAPQEDARAQGEGVKVRRRHAREEAPARAAGVAAAPEASAAPASAPETPAAPAPEAPAAAGAAPAEEKAAPEKSAEAPRQAARPRAVEAPR